jgi:hypothetical protein
LLIADGILLIAYRIAFHILGFSAIKNKYAPRASGGNGSS